MMKNSKFTSGFTLIEILTAVSIFLVIMTISTGSILGVFDANRKSRTLKTALSNLNLALESMSREMRFGSMYYCGPAELQTTLDCRPGESQMSFSNQSNQFVTYKLNNSVIERKVDYGASIHVTSPDTLIDSLVFYVLDSVPVSGGNTGQAKVLIKIQGHVGSGNTRTDFTLQTLISQRQLDF